MWKTKFRIILRQNNQAMTETPSSQTAHLKPTIRADLITLWSELSRSSKGQIHQLTGNGTHSVDGYVCELTF